MSLGRRLRLAAAGAAATVVTLGAARALGAQVVPNDGWRTLATPHFRVHYARGLEALGRRAAANAERAYAELSAELVPPRGVVDLVVSDNVDYTNGYATPTPTNRIVVYAHPPVDERTLRFYDEWDRLVITHELTHIFHLDRTRGVWRLAQRVFGRNPALFPNEYGPSWLTEGLAVYYESRLTGYGRIAGSAHTAYERAAAAGGALPRLDQLSLASPVFPRGDAAYAYGSLLVDYLSREQGAASVPAFVERSSAGLPLLDLDRLARRSFGISFTRAAARLRDSLSRDAAAANPAGAARSLVDDAYVVGPPRWTDAQHVGAVLNTGRETTALYVADTTGRLARGTRRNSAGPNVPLPDGGVLFAQLDYVDAYRVRSDLYVERAGRTRRLTRGARLSSPDARRADGAIVAVQARGESTALVRVDAGGRVRAITTWSPDTQWAEPRWSPDGARLAAVRIVGGAGSELVVLDTAGVAVRVAARSRYVESAPAWSADGRRLYFASDRTGTNEAYRVDADGDGPPVALTHSAGGSFTPAPSPDDRTLAAARLGARGFSLDLIPLGGAASPAADTLPPPHAGAADVGRAAFVVGASTPYRAWRTLVPRYWMPTIGTTGRGDRTFGAYTGSSDPVERHAYLLSAALAPSRPREPEAGLSYVYRGLGQPSLGVSAVQSWDYPSIFARGAVIGRLVERQRAAAISATLERPRYRTSSYLTAAAGVERDVFSADPDSLLPRLGRAAFYRSSPTYTTASLVGGWANTQRPTLSISPEDGVSLSARVVERWLDAAATPSPSAEAAVDLRGYRALDLPGFSHHVLAARVAAGAKDSRATTVFGAGGTSGTTAELVPGFSLGTSRREFGVRGFPAGAEEGTRAAAASVEYRAPLLLPARGVALLPLLLSKTSVSLFGDAASAWCPAGAAPLACGTAAPPRRTMASAGAELDVDAGLGFDQLYRLRFGVATPVAARELFGRSRAAAYFTVGLAY